MRRLSLLFIAIFIAKIATCQVRLPKIFGDNMVLQRGKGINVWGWAAPKEKVTVRFHNQTKQAIAGAVLHTAKSSHCAQANAK